MKAMIDILTPDEELFGKQVNRVIENAIVAVNAKSNMAECYLAVTNTIEALHLRSTKVYPEILKKISPDYTVQFLALDVQRMRLKRHIENSVKQERSDSDRSEPAN